MPIIEFHPKAVPIVDHRNAGKSYYVAICNSCGRTFYPLKSHAKYCSGQCQQQAWHKKEKSKEGTIQMEAQANGTEKMTNSAIKGIYHGRSKVISAFKAASIETLGLMVELKKLNLDENFVWHGYSVELIAIGKYWIS